MCTYSAILGISSLFIENSVISYNICLCTQIVIMEIAKQIILFFNPSLSFGLRIFR